MTKIFDQLDVEAAFGESALYLGTGSFGETWHVGTEAIKIIHRDSPLRVDREIEGLGRVDHPNVVHLLSAGSASIAGTDYQALHFEYIAGGDVEHALAAGGNLSVGDLPAFLRGLLEGVRALHNARVLHRDLKPGNVALREGRWADPVILDLGTARMLDMSSITNYPAHVGTLLHMPPEQIAAQRARKAADIFAIGLVTRLSLTGVHPFQPLGGNQIKEIIYGCRTLLARLVAMATDTPDAPHDELLCALWPHEEHGCDDVAVVSVVDKTGEGEWGCERHAAAALSVIDGTKISRVSDWAAARRLLKLDWNR